MGDSVEIGLREVYDAVKEVGVKVDTLVRENDILRYRIDQLEKRQDSTSTTRPVWLGVGGAYLSSVAAFLAPLFTK